jgi:hypothetical protein
LAPHCCCWRSIAGSGETERTENLAIHREAAVESNLSRILEELRHSEGEENRFRFHDEHHHHHEREEREEKTTFAQTNLVSDGFVPRPQSTRT